MLPYVNKPATLAGFIHNTPRHIIGFDTFCGIPYATPQDGRWNTHTGGTWSYPVDHVRENLLLGCRPVRILQDGPGTSL